MCSNAVKLLMTSHTSWLKYVTWQHAMKRIQGPLKAFWMVKIKRFLQQQQNLTLDTAITAEEAAKKQRSDITLVTNNNVFTLCRWTRVRYSLVAGVDHIKVTAPSVQPYISNVNWDVVIIDNNTISSIICRKPYSSVKASVMCWV